MKPAIRIDGLSKHYRIGWRQRGNYRTLRESLTDAAGASWRSARRLVSRSRSNGNAYGEAENHLWALKDVSFDVQPGEVLGIIGRNGAGKSTLLKILSRVVEPTAGRAIMHGRLGSLLEVGTGFHHELTGRENIYLNGSILGMGRREIDRKFDEIVAFSEVERFLDTPVKRYSSGMYVRLAFAVAAHLEPEILLVDEVLAVGDVQFQEKCLGKMREVGLSGRTVLLVSHNMASIRYLCHHVAVLEHGCLSYLGETQDAIKAYLGKALELSTGVDLRETPQRRNSSVPIIASVRMLDSDGQATDQFLCGSSACLEMVLAPPYPLGRPHVGIGFDDVSGSRLFSVATYLANARMPPIEAPTRVICRLAELPLLPGRYSLSLSAGTEENKTLDAIEHAVSFEVQPADYYLNGRMPMKELGPFLMRSDWLTLPV